MYTVMVSLDPEMVIEKGHEFLLMEITTLQSSVGFPIACKRNQSGIVLHMPIPTELEI